VRISVSEWSALKLALKVPRQLLNPELLAETLRKHSRTRRGMAAIGIVLLALLVVLHVMAASSAVARLTDVVAQLASAKLIDARWDAAAVQARSVAPARATAIEASDLAQVQRALDAAAAAARTNAARESVTGLRKDYVEKADVLARFERASADARQALAAAMRSDAAVITLVRKAWREFPQRERLVAAENLVVRVIVEMQKYHYAPNAAHRASLESYAVDLPRAKELPKPIQSGMARLEADVHRMLLLKPLEQTLGERLAALKTGQRLAQTSDLFQRELADAIKVSDRYSIALTIYTLALVVLLSYLGVRAIARYRDLELLYAAQTRELAKALRRSKSLDPPVALPRRPASRPAEEEADVVSEKRR
jgi:hypothetical protein